MLALMIYSTTGNWVEDNKENYNAVAYISTPLQGAAYIVFSSFQAT